MADQQLPLGNLSNIFETGNAARSAHFLVEWFTACGVEQVDWDRDREREIERERLEDRDSNRDSNSDSSSVRVRIPKRWRMTQLTRKGSTDRGGRRGSKSSRAHNEMGAAAATSTATPAAYCGWLAVLRCGRSLGSRSRKTKLKTKPEARNGQRQRRTWPWAALSRRIDCGQ